MNIEVVETKELGDRSYLVHEGHKGFVIDPQRDVDRFEQLLAELGVTCDFVLETHLHNDYVSGGLELSKRTASRYCLPEHSGADFEHHVVRDGDVLQVGHMTIQVIATPGHTDEHVSYIVGSDTGESAVFSGGSLLYGSVGRTDLMDPHRTVEMTRAQFQSAHRLAYLATDEAGLYPTHGFGSFCSSGASTGGESSTIGKERARNDAFTAIDEERFVEALIAGLSAYPSYYAHMGHINRKGAGPVDPSPAESVDSIGLAKRLQGGQWVVDMRSKGNFAASHIAKTINIGMGERFATYVGWLMPWETQLTLMGESDQQIAAAQRQLVRIGIERLDGAAVGSPADLVGSDAIRCYRTATFADLGGDLSAQVLDVRRDDERKQGFVEGSIHIPLHELLDRIEELPAAPLWVHCATGYRASIATSLLDREGHEVVLIDDDFENAVGAIKA